MATLDAAAVRNACDALLSRGGVRSQDVSACRQSLRVVLEVAATQANTLQRLALPFDILFSVAELPELLLRAAQVCHMCELVVAVKCSSRAEAQAVLRNPPRLERLCAPRLRLGRLSLDESALAAALPLLGDHPVSGIQLHEASLFADVAAALFDAVRARGLTTLGFVSVCFGPGVAPLLTALLREDWLAELNVGHTREADVAPVRPWVWVHGEAGAQLLAHPPHPAPARFRPSVALCAALAACVWLTRLTWDAGGGDEWRLIRAVTNHPTLAKFKVNLRRSAVPDDAAAVASALGALVAANASALACLSVGSLMGDDGLRDLVVALPANTHLRQLDIKNNGLGDGFARDVLLPALRANASLRSLSVYTSSGIGPISHCFIIAEGIPFMRS